MTGDKMRTALAGYTIGLIVGMFVGVFGVLVFQGMQP